MNPTCGYCGRLIFRPWVDGVEMPWRHSVEPFPHAARPVEEGITETGTGSPPPLRNGDSLTIEELDPDGYITRWRVWRASPSNP